MYTMTEKRNIKLKFLRDVEFIMSDSNQEFDWCKITIKKDTIINIGYCVYEVTSYEEVYTCEIEFRDNDGIIIEILKESDNDINDVEELRKELLFLEINAKDVMEVK